jgi:hypothetical protein
MPDSTTPRDRLGAVEDAVAAAARAGDEAAFAELVGRHRRERHLHRHRMLGSFEEAEVPWLQPSPDRLLDELAPSATRPDGRGRGQGDHRADLSGGHPAAPAPATGGVACSWRASSTPTSAPTPRPRPRWPATTSGSPCRRTRGASTGWPPSDPSWRRGSPSRANGASSPPAPTASQPPPATSGRRATPGSGRSSSTCCASRAASSPRSPPRRRPVPGVRRPGPSRCPRSATPAPRRTRPQPAGRPAPRPDVVVPAAAQPGRARPQLPETLHPCLQQPGANTLALMSRVDQQQPDAPGGVESHHAHPLAALTRVAWPFAALSPPQASASSPRGASRFGDQTVPEHVQRPGQQRPDRPEGRLPEPLQQRPVASRVERPESNVRTHGAGLGRQRPARLRAGCRPGSEAPSGTNRRPAGSRRVAGFLPRPERREAPEPTRPATPRGAGGDPPAPRGDLPAVPVSCTRWWCRTTRRRSRSRPGASGPRRSSSRGRRPRPCPG